MDNQDAACTGSNKEDVEDNSQPPSSDVKDEVEDSHPPSSDQPSSLDAMDKDDAACSNKEDVEVDSHLPSADVKDEVEDSHLPSSDQPSSLDAMDKDDAACSNKEDVEDDSHLPSANVKDEVEDSHLPSSDQPSSLDAMDKDDAACSNKENVEDDSHPPSADVKDEVEDSHVLSSDQPSSLDAMGEDDAACSNKEDVEDDSDPYSDMKQSSANTSKEDHPSSLNHIHVDHQDALCSDKEEVEEDSHLSFPDVKQSSAGSSEDDQPSPLDHMDNEEQVKEDDHLPSSGVKQSSAGSPEVGQLSSEITDELEKHDIFQLKKKSLRFPRAKFFCRLCSYHLDTVELCNKHWKEPRHSQLEKNKKVLQEITSIDLPSKAHTEALSATLEATVDKIALTEDDMSYREKIADTVKIVLQKSMADVEVILYGSSLSGFGFRDSDVNLCIEAPEGSVPSQVLVKAWEAFTPKDPHFEDVQADFEDRFPCVRFKDKNSGLRCELCTGSVSACETSQLLRRYRKLYPRVLPLAMSLRYWARICKLDCQSEGTMPAYAFVIMTIYFLQRCEPPVLPVLQEEETLQHQNTDGLGELWIKMLRFYTVEAKVEELVLSVRKREPVHRDDLKISCKRLAIEDPIAVNKKNIAKSLSSNIMFQYLMRCLQNALLYFGKPQLTGSGDKLPHQSEFSSKGRCENDHASPEGQPADGCHPTSQGTETTPGREPAGHDCPQSSEDERSPKANVSETQTKTTIEPQGQINGNWGSDSGIDSSVQSSVIESDFEITTESKVTKISGSHNAGNDTENTCDEPCTCSPDCADQGAPLDSNRETDLMQLDDSPQQFNFVFDEEILTGGQKITVCSGCGQEGHNATDCPEDTLPDLVKLPRMQKGFMNSINSLSRQIAVQLCLKDWEAHQRVQAVNFYEDYIRRNGYPDVRLYLFGSSMNGFGFTESDMDVCMRLQQNETAEDLDIPNIVNDLAKKLRKNRKFRHVISIPTAKVPIVKFEDANLYLDVDISLYNCLAQENTHMLSVYSRIDPRVKELVYTVKVFAKVCDIGDASKGSLSSYAYTLMAIFFLQQRNPPVLPVLQEIYEGATKPKHIVEGCNAYFFSDLRKLMWRGNNRESVGELWLGFLRFFTEEFDSKKFVVSIKQHEPLTRFEKMWTGASRGFAIEDPFDLDHNLGSGVSKRMAIFIMRVFINARKRFGTPMRISPYYRNDYEFFFDTNVLTGGEAPPNDRCCKMCGKIGHFAKECPRQKGQKEANTRRDKDDEMKKRQEKDKHSSNTNARDGKSNAARVPEKIRQESSATESRAKSGTKTKTFQAGGTARPGPNPPSTAARTTSNLQNHKQLSATSNKAAATSEEHSKREKYNANPKDSYDKKKKSQDRPLSQRNRHDMEHGVSHVTPTPQQQNRPQPTRNSRLHNKQMMSTVQRDEQPLTREHQQMTNCSPGSSGQQNAQPPTREHQQMTSNRSPGSSGHRDAQPPTRDHQQMMSNRSPGSSGHRDAQPPTRDHQQMLSNRSPGSSGHRDAQPLTTEHQQMMSNRSHGSSGHRDAQPLTRDAFQKIQIEQQHVANSRHHQQSYRPNESSPSRDVPGNYCLFPPSKHDGGHPRQWNLQNSSQNTQQYPQIRNKQQEPTTTWQEPTTTWQEPTSGWQEATRLHHHANQRQHIHQHQGYVPQQSGPTLTRNNQLYRPPFVPENRQPGHHWPTTHQPKPEGTELQHNQFQHRQSPPRWHWTPQHQQPNHHTQQAQQELRIPDGHGFTPEVFSELAKLQLRHQQLPPSEKPLMVEDLEGSNHR